MFEDENLDNKFEQLERKIQELTLRIEACDRQEQELFNELEMTPEQLTAFVQNKENFTEKNWDKIQKQRQERDENLDRDLKNIRNPRKSKQAFEERNINPQWIYVK